MNYSEEKIDETIKALKICSTNDPDGKKVPSCPICPYYGIHNCCCECLMRDAAGLMEQMRIDARKAGN